MQVQKKPLKISVSLATNVQLDERELAFLRNMARHCIDTKMPGNAACQRLDEILANMQIVPHTGPVYGIFVEEDDE